MNYKLQFISHDISKTNEGSRVVNFHDICLLFRVCSCAMSSNFVWLQIIFCSCANETTYASRSFPKQKYRDLSVSRRSIDLLATDKSRYFAQPRSIIANSLFIYPRNTKDLWFSFCSLFQQKPCGNKNEFNWILQGEVDIHNFVFIFYLEKFKVFFVVVARFRAVNWAPKVVFQFLTPINSINLVLIVIERKQNKTQLVFVKCCKIGPN